MGNMIPTDTEGIPTDTEGTPTRLTNEEKIIKRVKLMLGSSVLKLEIGDKEIKEFIATAIDTVEPYIVDYKYITIPMCTSVDLSTYDIEEVLRVIPGSNLVSQYGVGDEYQFDFTPFTIFDRNKLFNGSQMMINMVSTSVTPDVDIPFDYDERTKMLYITPGITTGSVTLECIPTIYSVNDLYNKATLKWVYLYTLALAKEVVGRIRSKAKSSNVPIELDGDTLLQEAASEKSALENSLMADATGPVAMIR